MEARFRQGVAIEKEAQDTPQVMQVLLDKEVLLEGKNLNPTFNPST